MDAHQQWLEAISEMPPLHMALSVLFVGTTPIHVNFFGRSFVLVRSFVCHDLFSSTRKNFGGTKILKKNWGRSDRFRQQNVQIQATLAIFEPFEVLKFRTPLFGEFG